MELLIIIRLFAAVIVGLAGVGAIAWTFIAWGESREEEGR